MRKKDIMEDVSTEEVDELFARIDAKNEIKKKIIEGQIYWLKKNIPKLSEETITKLRTGSSFGRLKINCSECPYGENWRPSYLLIEDMKSST